MLSSGIDETVGLGKAGLSTAVFEQLENAMETNNQYEFSVNTWV